MDVFIRETITAGGAWGIAMLMLLENIFPPIPSELIMPFAGFEAAAGRLSFWAVVIAGTLGSVAGAVVWYAAGRGFGEARTLALIDRYGFWLTISREEAERALAWFARRGALAVFLGRLVPGVRTIISVPAGVAAMPFGKFLAITALGSLVWVVMLTLAGYLLEANYERVAHLLDPATKVILGVILVTYVWRAYRLWRNRA
jgi:membrane protein DedA with SNARE-associated domain